jgi:hypothetical protein
MIWYRSHLIGRQNRRSVHPFLTDFANSGRSIKQAGRSIKRRNSGSGSSKSGSGRRIKQCERTIIPFGDGSLKTVGSDMTRQRSPTQGETNMTTHNGKCFCGAIEIEVQGSPEAMGYCHCSSCRSWSAGPVNAFTLWQPQNVRVTKGAEHLGKFMKTETSNRQFCKRCGGHLMTDHPTLGLVDVYAATIPTLSFSPGVHVNYAETVLPMKDGLPKLKDFPAELGGSGIALPE